jgi:small-conductance mechanosensitive channel
VRLVLSLILVYIFLSVTFSLFPFSRGWDLEPIFRGVLLSLVATVFGAGLWKLGATFFTVARKKFNEWKGTVIRGVRIREFELFSEDRIVALSLTLVTGVQYAGVLLLGYAYLTIVFSVFEFSRTWAQTLFGYVTDPVLEVLTSFVAFLPDLFFIIVVVAITRFVLKIIKGIFEEVSRGRVTLGNFHRDWAMPTYQIVRFLVIAFAAVVIFPYLPGSGSAAFQGISVFLGILFSLGSSSAIANMVAGIVITYMRPFQIGDRVKIADTAGDVVERNLLVTRVRTVKNVDVTIPNAMVLGSHIINYSSTSGTRSLILHTSVTIGYDVPWRKVHELLLAAAKDSKEILEDPAPFVLQTSLDDYSVAYELNAHTDNPSRMAAIYSDLHQNIQDKFNEAGVEIMSPSYSAVRDGNQVTIPPDYLPKEYTPASFRIFPLGNLFSSQTKRQESEKGEKS